MATLRVSSGFVQILDGLGKIRDFRTLSEKRVTAFTREALRRKYGKAAIRVSCSANCEGSNWNGICWLNGKELNYCISTL
jgi:hypothetical protein